MSRQADSKEAPSEAIKPSGLRAWLDPHRKRFWAASLVVLYTLVGFLLVPVVTKSLLIGALRDDLGRVATVERVRFNPYVLSLEINGFSLFDPDDVTLAEFDRFFANFQLSSLFRWAWTFREVSLEGFATHFERFAPGDSRLTRLLADQAARAEPAAPVTEDEVGLPRLLIHDLVLKEGRVRFRDDVPADPVDLEFGPVDVSMQSLNTIPDRHGRQTVRISLPGGALVSWQGTIDLAPLLSEGTFAVENSHLDQTIAYLKAFLPLESMEALLSLRTQYRIEEIPDGSVGIELDELEVEFANIALSGLTPSTEFLALPAVQAYGGTLRYPENLLNFASVRISRPMLKTWLDEGGDVNLLQLLPPATDSNAMVDSSADGAAPWRLGISEFIVEEGQVEFEDRSIEPPAALAMQHLDLTVSDLSNEDHAVFPIQIAGGLSAGGDFGFDGKITLLPELSLRGALSANSIPLAIAQPHTQQFVNVRINAGVLNLSTDVSLDPAGSLAADGQLTIAQLQIDDTRSNEPLVGWDRLEIDRFEATSEGRELGLSLVTFERPFGRLVINEDLTTNLTGLAIASDTETDQPDPEAETAAPFTVVVGGTRVRDGSMDFSDFSLPLPFATHIQKLNGTISTVDSSSAAPSNIQLEGQVDEYGLARIEGAMDLLDPLRGTDVTMEFRNLLMSNFSPYTVQFAGRKIDEGKLDLNLGYRINQGQLQGQNDIVMSDLVLGAEVDQPGAVSLPLGLAVALLTDANGVIDIDLPVEGDVNDPEFAIGGVIWQAFAGLVTKIVTAPFRLLGSLIGVESEDLGQFQFLAGRANLSPPELEKIAQLQQALQQRPELVVEVSGAFDPTIDTPALQTQRLREVVRERVGQDYADQEEEFRMLDEEIRGVLESLFAERNPEIPLETVRAAHMAPPVDDPESKPVLDSLAYATDLRDRLLAGEEISQQDLETLANARAEAIRAEFLASGEFDEKRIVLAAPQTTESEDDEWVMMELGVVAE